MLEHALAHVMDRHEGLRLRVARTDDGLRLTIGPSVAERLVEEIDLVGMTGLECRPYRKNDQAFVEQKNGAVVREMVGYIHARMVVFNAPFSYNLTTLDLKIALASFGLHLFEPCQLRFARLGCLGQLSASMLDSPYVLRAPPALLRQSDASAKAGPNRLFQLALPECRLSCKRAAHRCRPSLSGRPQRGL